MTGLNLRKLFDAFATSQPRLTALARARTGSADAARDLMQDVWLRLDAVDAERPIENPLGYVAQVASNAITDHLRKERRRAARDQELSDLLSHGAEEATPERILIARQGLRAVEAALSDMPEKTRRIFLMNRIDGVSHRLIARRLGVSEQAVYYHIRRAIEALAAARDEAL